MFNYNEYTAEHDDLFRKCLILHKKFAGGSVEFKEDGKVHKFDMSNPEVAEAVSAEKLSLYGEYMDWLQQHPIEQIKKYLTRYESHRKFLEKEVEKRDYIVVESRSPPKQARPGSNLFLLYLIAGMVGLWLAVNLYRLWRS